MKETNNMDRKTIAFIGTGVMGRPYGSSSR